MAYERHANGKKNRYSYWTGKTGFGWASTTANGVVCSSFSIRVGISSCNPTQPGDFDLAFNPIVSITQAGQDLYLAGSMRHTFTQSHVARVAKLTATTVFTSESCWDETAGEQPFVVYGQSVSLLAFSPGDNQLYACIDGAIMKANVTNQSAPIDRWTQVIPRRPTDNDRLVRMAFTPTGQLALLYKNRGLGLFDGKTVRFMKPVTQPKNG